MNEEAVACFINLIILAMRITPVFICLKPKHGNYEKIAAVSAYIWVIMVSAQAIFHISDASFTVFKGLFSALFFLILMIFFEGSLLLKAFLYISAWLFADFSASLDAFFSWLLRFQSRLTGGQLSLILAVMLFVLFYFFVRFWLKDRILILFDRMTFRDGALMLAVPAAFLLLLFLGSRTLFRTEVLLGGDPSAILFYLVFCLMILCLYILMISDLLRIFDQRSSRIMLEAAWQLVELKKENYNQMQEYQQKIRLLRHDFRHYIHALQHMDDHNRRTYLEDLQFQLDTAAELFFCHNAAVNALLQKYGGLARAEEIPFEAEVSLTEQLPADDLTLCVMIGNLLENALEASRKCTGERWIRLWMKSEDGALRIMVRNRFEGKLRIHEGSLLSTKREGGLGLLSIRRLLDAPGDDFDYYFDGEEFSAMVYLSVRGHRNSFERQTEESKAYTPS